MKEIKKSTHDEWVDKELQSVGVKFTDRTAEAEEVPVADIEAVAENDVLTNEEIIRHNRRCRALHVMTSACSLVAADALLMFMCLAGKIELAYGLVFLAAASAFFGAKVNDARV